MDILKKYSKMGWIRYISEPDKGIFDAMNKGIHSASGEYIAFLNSDDFYHDKNGVANTLEALITSGADFSYADCIEIDENGKSLISSSNIIRVFNFAPFYHLTMFTKKQVLTDNKMFNTKYKVAADCDLIMRLCLQGCTSVKIKNHFASFRKGGISTDKNICINELLQINFENFGKLVNISEKECLNMVWNKYMPFFLFKKIVKKVAPKNLFFCIKIFIYYYLL